MILKIDVKLDVRRNLEEVCYGLWTEYWWIKLVSGPMDGM